MVAKGFSAEAIASRSDLNGNGLRYRSPFLASMRQMDVRISLASGT